MTLLDFARGPALDWALTIFVVGMLWRLVGVLALRRKKDLSEPRNEGAGFTGAVKMIVARMWPKREFVPVSRLTYLMAYAFHIGLAIVVFGFGPHIAFIKDLTGLSWPNLPTGLITVASVITLAGLIGMLVRRLGNPVVYMLSNLDDWLSWLLTTLPVITGLMAVTHWGGRYETLLALHILSVEALLIWIPFGKLAHVFFVFISRGTTGAVLERRGAGI